MQASCFLAEQPEQHQRREHCGQRHGNDVQENDP
jgi:hypothetical protein